MLDVEDIFKSTIKTRRRSYMWKFFKLIEKTKVRCKLCSATLGRYNGNLTRHIKSKHKFAFARYERFKETRGTATNDNETKIKPEQCMGSWVKKYMYKIRNGLYQCNICCTNLRLADGRNGNMKRHIYKKHPYIHEKETKTVHSDDEAESMVEKDTRADKTAVVDKSSHTDTDIQITNQDTLIQDICTIGETFSENVNDENTIVGYIVEEETLDDCNKLESSAIFVKDLHFLKKNIRDSVATTSHIIEGEKTQENLATQVKPEKYVRPWVQKYMNKMSTNLYQCNVCFENLKMPHGLYGNMKRHILRKHPFIYTKETGTVHSDHEVAEKYTSTVVGKTSYKDNNIQITNQDTVIQDDNTTGNQISENINNENTVVRFVFEEDTLVDDSEAEQSLTRFVKNISTTCHIPGEETIQESLEKPERSKRAWVKNYMNKVSSNLYQCNVCFTNLKMPHGLYGNMKRHILKKHPSIHAKETAKLTEMIHSADEDAKVMIGKDTELDKTTDSSETEQSSAIFVKYKDNINQGLKIRRDSDASTYASDSDQEDMKKNELLEMADSNIEDKIKRMCQKDPGNGRRNCFWNFVKYIDDNVYACLFCGQTIRIQGLLKNIWNIKRHMKAKHLQAFQWISENSSSTCETEENLDVEESVYYRESYDKSHFEEMEDGFKCKTCDMVLSSLENEHILFDHVKENHPNQMVFCREESIPIDDSCNVVIVGSTDMPII